MVDGRWQKTKRKLLLQKGVLVASLKQVQVWLFTKVNFYEISLETAYIVMVEASLALPDQRSRWRHISVFPDSNWLIMSE
jgi:hypothetical protein